MRSIPLEKPAGRLQETLRPGKGSGMMRRIFSILFAFLVAGVFVIAVPIYELFYSPNRFPKGTLMKSVESPDHRYKVNIYLTNGGATVDFGIRGELEDEGTHHRRNIYWQYHEDRADVFWVDNHTVSINGHVLNIARGQTYFWRPQ
ncbi:DUF5412 family protein [Alicyclobacillus sp.]|uniref:DUF5412 family protein n=1 Tax=Alicyclobacillus sp. TaxID=61169 RepID=UPI00345A82DC|nr:DUF5412 domain-containing protein [Alicyclobacillus sp.]